MPISLPRNTAGVFKAQYFKARYQLLDKFSCCFLDEGMNVGKYEHNMSCTTVDKHDTTYHLYFFEVFWARNPQGFSHCQDQPRWATAFNAQTCKFASLLA